MNDRTAFDTATRIVAADDGTNYDDVAIALQLFPETDFVNAYGLTGGTECPSASAA